jgi:hypothetical protein
MRSIRSSDAEPSLCSSLWSALPPARTNISPPPEVLNVAILPGTGVVSTAAVPPATQVVFVTSNAFDDAPWISNTFPYPWLRQTPSIDPSRA